MKLLKAALIVVAAAVLAPIFLFQVFDLLTSTRRATTTTAETVTAPAPRDCVGMRNNRVSAWDVGDEKYRQFMKEWVETCEREAATDSSAAVQLAWYKALFSNNRRPEAIVVLRALAAAGNADALLEIYEWHRSWEDRDVDKVQIVTAKEAGESLRKAAEAGHPEAMRRYAIDLEQGGIIKRDVDQAAYWTEQSLAKADENANPEQLAIGLGRLLAESSDPEKRARGVSMLELRSYRPLAKAYLAVAIRKDNADRARALSEETLREWPGISLPPLADMLIKGEGGPADGKRALKLLQSHSRVSAPASINEALGKVYAEGKLVPAIHRRRRS
jgi:TPR repeat protein